jgi:2-polyprenyl-3-methyl-5-hydroxy-6-metoxy-1,4-benzoquinol methylase
VSKPALKFDPESVRDAWDRAATAYWLHQATGRDYYRYEFFGPAQLLLCGEVQGQRILDVGCGTGYFSRELARRGASVTGIDISPGMIAYAKREEAVEPLGVRYEVLDAGDLPAPGLGVFDMAASCVALQDMPAVPAVFRGVRSTLRPGARFVISITHPCTDTPYRAWDRDEGGTKRALCINRYFARETIAYTWRDTEDDVVTPALHATLEDWFGWILSAGFQVLALREPCPTAEAIAHRPQLRDAAMVPYILMLDLAVSP